jgi:hypothetical protein
MPLTVEMGMIVHVYNTEEAAARVVRGRSKKIVLLELDLPKILAPVA